MVFGLFIYCSLFFLHSQSHVCTACVVDVLMCRVTVLSRLEVVAGQPDMPLTHSQALLATAVSHFYSSQVCDTPAPFTFMSPFL